MRRSALYKNWQQIQTNIVETIAHGEHEEAIHEIKEERKEEDDGESGSMELGRAEAQGLEDYRSENFNETSAEDVSQLTANPVPVSARTGSWG